MVRNGLRGRTQRYKCNDCGRRFDGGIRRDKSQVITDYVEGKQTLEQLAIKYGVNEKTIRRDLEEMRYVYKIARRGILIEQIEVEILAIFTRLRKISIIVANRVRLWVKGLTQ